MHQYAKKQQGAASIEFVFIFVVFFMLFYGMVTLAFPLILSATYEELSAEGLREAVTLRSYKADAYTATDTDKDQKEINAAKINIDAAVEQVVKSTWLPSKWVQFCDGYSSSYLKVNGSVWSVCIGHNNPSSILPKINLLGFDVISLPDTIRGEAVISF